MLLPDLLNSSTIIGLLLQCFLNLLLNLWIGFPIYRLVPLIEIGAISKVLLFATEARL
jgi:hypothetical protein